MSHLVGERFSFLLESQFWKSGFLIGNCLFDAARFMLGMPVIIAWSSVCDLFSFSMLGSKFSIQMRGFAS